MNSEINLTTTQNIVYSKDEGINADLGRGFLLLKAGIPVAVQILSPDEFLSVYNVSQPVDFQVCDSPFSVRC